MHALALCVITQLTLAVGPGPEVSAHLSAQEHQPMGDLALETWWVHEGGLPSLAPVPGTGASATSDRLNELTMAVLVRNAETSENTEFSKQTVPVKFDLLARNKRDSQNDGTWWMMSQFTADEETTQRGVGAWVEITDCYFRIFINGRLIGEYGSQDPLFLRSPLPRSFVIPPDVLYSDRLNTLAIEMRSDLFAVEFGGVRLTTVVNLQNIVHSNFTLNMTLVSGTMAVLAVLAAFSFGWTLRRRQERDSFYMSLGVLGYAVLLTCNWVHWPPASGAPDLVAGTFGAWIASAFTLYFQMRYEIHQSPIWRRLFGWGFLAIVFATLLCRSKQDLLILLSISVAVSLASFLYCGYLNVVAYRRGNKDAFRVLVGYVVFALCVGADMIQLMLFHMTPKNIFAVGVAAFVTATVTTLTSRFLKLHESSAQTAMTLQRRQELQEYVVEQISATASEIEQVAGHILVSATQQQQGATEQATAVEETRITMESLLASGRTITTAAQDVLRNAEMTQRHNLSVGDRITESTKQSGRITEILEVIRDVANKSELLALNAALEGSRAGEQGRGFALVASEMQRLAETVMAAVTDIKSLTGDIRHASAATESGTQEATRLANETTVSAKQIGLIIQGQQAGTEQVSKAMDDIADVAVQTTRLGRITLEGTQTLSQMAERLRSLIGELRHDRPTN